MALTCGTKLGPYEIQSTLGASGMGEVYRARDTRLDRTVVKAADHLAAFGAAEQGAAVRIEQVSATWVSPATPCSCEREQSPSSTSKQYGCFAFPIFCHASC
jgi:serine/threonine protein kinase